MVQAWIDTIPTLWHKIAYCGFLECQFLCQCHRWLNQACPILRRQYLTTSCDAHIGRYCSKVAIHMIGYPYSYSRVLCWDIHTGPLYVTSTYSYWIFCRGVSGFATDCPCGAWCRGLTACLLGLLYVGPLFGNLLLNNNWAVSFT